MIRVGIIPMAARPFHAGHAALVELAASECDSVRVIASSFTDRGCIRAVTMRSIWTEHIIPRLPPNVVVTTSHIPVRDAYEALGMESERDQPDGPTFVIYGDAHDVITTFPDDKLRKYMSNLFERGKVIRRPVERRETVDISGERMRAWLTSDDKVSFCDHLPAWMDKRAVWIRLREDLQ